MTGKYPDAADIWRVYVGDASPLEFLRQQGASTLEACVESYVDPLPRFEGIVRRATWTSAFRAEYQLRSQEVIRGLLEHLEHTRSEWETDWSGPPEFVVATEPLVEDTSVSAAPSEQTATTDASSEEATTEETTN
ncbi:MAG: hypothetical protein GC168_01745 [Candidatus Hydrogenedens sp.]|nr:hypothetical protein [Candidatus Hydrogenedens sp.]